MCLHCPKTSPGSPISLFLSGGRKVGGEAEGGEVFRCSKDRFNGHSTRTLYLSLRGRYIWKLSNWLVSETWVELSASLLTSDVGKTLTRKTG